MHHSRLVNDPLDPRGQGSFENETFQEAQLAVLLEAILKTEAFELELLMGTNSGKRGLPVALLPPQVELYGGTGSYCSDVKFHDSA